MNPILIGAVFSMLVAIFLDKVLGANIDYQAWIIGIFIASIILYYVNND